MEDREFAQNTLTTICKHASTDTEYLGGHTASLLYRMLGELPGDDWANRCLDYANLAEANLADKSFEGTTFRYATLHNANLTNSNLCRANLEGVVFDELSAVTALAVYDDRWLYAGYDNGQVKAWRVETNQDDVYYTLCEPNGQPVQQLLVNQPNDLLVIGAEQVRLLHIQHDGTQEPTVKPNGQYAIEAPVTHTHFEQDTLWFMETGSGTALGKAMAIATRQVHHNFSLPSARGWQSLNTQTFVATTGQALNTYHINQEAEEERVHTLPTPHTCFACCTTEEDDKRLLALGHESGAVTVYEWANNTWEECKKFTAHEGKVNALAFRDVDTLFSSSVDRTIGMWKAHTGEKLHTLYRKINCKGAKVTGLEPEAIRKQLIKAGAVE